MSGLDEVGARDGWRCWICDEKVDPDKSVNDARGPSIDSYFTAGKSAKGKKANAKKAKIKTKAEVDVKAKKSKPKSSKKAGSKRG